MAYYYVKSGGTATGDAGRATSKRTGSFATMGASAYYDDIAGALAATTAPTNGDYILVSDQSSNIRSNTVTWTIAEGVYIASVDDSNADAAATTGNSAIEGATGSTSALQIYANPSDSGKVIYHYSMEYRVGDAFMFRGTHAFVDCTLHVGDNYFGAATDGCMLTFIRCSFVFTNISGFFRVVFGSRYIFYGCDFSLSVILRIDKLFDLVGGGGGNAEMFGCNISSIMDSSSTGGIFNIDGSTDDVNSLRMVNCKMPSNVPVIAGTATNGAYEAILQGCGTATTDQWNTEAYTSQGVCVSEVGTSHFRSGDIKTPDGTNYKTYKLSPNADAERNRPLRLFLIMRHEGDYATNGKVTVHMSCDTAGLDNTDFWIEPEYADATDKMLWRPAHSSEVGSDGRMDPIGAGTALSTETGQWSGGGSSEYTIEATLTSGADGLVGVWVCCHDDGAGTTDFYVSSTVTFNP